MPNYQQIAANAARLYGLNPNIFLRQIGAESNFNPNARSSAGAEGIAQFMPATAKEYGVDPYNPVSALKGAARYDAGLLSKYGSYARMLSAYNSGNPDAYKNPSFARGQTANYVSKILKGTNPYIAAGATSAASTPTDGVRANLLQYLIQSNNALANQQPAPSLFPFLMQANSTSGGGFSAPSPSNNAPSVPAGSKTDGAIEKFAAPYGLTVTSTTGGQHADHSYHYLGRAVDFGGDPNKMAALAQQALKTGGWTELIYTGPGNTGYSILGGKVIPNSQLPKSLYDEHTNHVHIAK